MTRLGLYGFAVFAVGRLHELVAFPPRAVLVCGAFTIVGALLLPPTDRNPLWPQREVRIVLALVTLAVLLIPFAVWPGGSARFLRVKYCPVPVFFVLIVALATTARTIQRLVWSVLVAVGLLGMYTISRAAVSSGRAYAGSTLDPNDVAMLMVMTLSLAAPAVVGVRGVARMVATGVVVICVLATIMTMSRGGFIGLALVSLILLFRLGRTSLLPRLALLGATVFLLAVAAPEQYWSRMSTIWNPTGGGYDQTGYDQTGVFSRMDLWEQGVTLLVQNAVVGVGLGMYEIAEGLSHDGRGKWSAAHNSFIQVGTELGVLGLVLFVALLVRSIRNARGALRAANEDSRLHQLGWVAAGVETALYGYLVLGSSLSQAYSPMLYSLIGLATALRIQVERHRGPVTGPDALEIVRA